jgi:sugar phosphate isomerase/epimerase
MPRLHLGINTCFAVKRWPEPEQWLDIIRQDLDLDCCQFSLDLVDPLLDFETLAAERNVLLHSTFTGLAAYSWSQLLHPGEQMRTAALRWYERAIDFTTQLGAWGMGGHIGAFSVRDANEAERRSALLAEMTRRLNYLARYAAVKGLRFLLFENMAVEREYGHSIEEARALASLVTSEDVPLVLCLDVGHPCALHTGTASDDYLAWLEQPWPHAPVIHLQQTDRGSDHHWPFIEAYNSAGLIRPADVIAAIQQWDASDIYLFLEPIHPFEADDASVLQDLRESARYWKEAIAQA